MSITKALLIGNGMSSQLIPNYKNERIMERFIAINEKIFNNINCCLAPYRGLSIDDETTIKMLLINDGVEISEYENTFIDMFLLEQLKEPIINDIETLMKVGKLFQHKLDFELIEIEKIAKEVVYNNGDIGINAVVCNLDKCAFKEFINSHSYVFTTNYDEILDEVYESKVKHLHGGFRIEMVQDDNGRSFGPYEGDISIERAYLVWGGSSKEKTEKSSGGLRWPIRWDPIMHESCMETDLTTLSRSLIDELHIWGYSGLNDRHINEAIAGNANITKIYFYINPNELNNKEVENKIRLLFNNVEHVYFKGWNSIWNRFK